MPRPHPIRGIVRRDRLHIGWRSPPITRAGLPKGASAQIWTCGRCIGHFCPDLLLGEAEADEPEHAEESLGVDGVCHAGREHGGDVVEVNREEL
jgi:hypothetical protein